MKRSLGSSDSLGAPLMPICPSADEQCPRKYGNGREFESMLEEEEETGHQCEKKRRLRVDQVKALEKNFEIENKLEPDRKVKLAQQLGLQPRQVAVWFQNRRARWKTKQLERDYGVLKANYDALKLNYEALKQDNQALQEEIEELKKSRVEEEKSGRGVSVIALTTDRDKMPSSDQEYLNNSEDGDGDGDGVVAAVSDSDSSAILNEDASGSGSGSGFLQSHQLLVSYYVKMEEQNLLSGDESCNLFSEEQPPTLPWYCSHQWT